jgi:hypothetical protein
MKTRTLLFAIMILILPATSSAQIGGLLKKAGSKVLNTVGKEASKEASRQADSIAQEKAQNAIDKHNQKLQDNQNDSAGSQDQGSRGQRKGALTLGSVFGGADIKHNDEYGFDGRMYMQMEMYDKKDVVKSDYFIYFNQMNSNAGIEFKTIAKEGEESAPLATVMVYDNENKCFMMLIDKEGQKTGIISTLPSDSVMKARTAEKSGAESKPANVVKTGNSRVIAGYKCDEYKITEQDKKGYALAWMTKDLKIKADKSNWGKAGIPSYYGAGLEGSSMLAMESYDESNKLAMKMETKEINQNYPHKISAAGFTFIKMNFNQMNSAQPKK